MKDATKKRKEALLLKKLIEDDLEILVNEKCQKPECVDVKRIFSLILKNKGHSLIDIAEFVHRAGPQVGAYTRELRWSIKHDQQPKDDYYRILTKFNRIMRNPPEVAENPKKVVHLNYYSWRVIKPEYIRMHDIYQLLSTMTPAGKEREVRDWLEKIKPYRPL